ncbi:hypothetical protein NEDG_00774 [Nematocida displodere]|uniref:PRA1 family protein n=1 Tax=Nematocida displodere TaxID=1805483 RepID=A0A177EDQ6_9MICR|nr:hypothetical protein NEDG_00774 [Nematocida displodere]
MNSRLSTELSYYLKEKSEKRVPLKEFLNVSNITLPEGLEMAKARILLNYTSMSGNYLLILGVLACLYLVLNPVLILPFGCSIILVYLAYQGEGDEVAVLGYNLKKEHVYWVSIAIPILFFILKPGALVGLFFVISIGVLLSIGHMVASTPAPSKEEDI